MNLGSKSIQAAGTLKIVIIKRITTDGFHDQANVLCNTISFHQLFALLWAVDMVANINKDGCSKHEKVRNHKSTMHLDFKSKSLPSKKQSFED